MDCRAREEEEDICTRIKFLFISICSSGWLLVSVQPLYHTPSYDPFQGPNIQLCPVHLSSPDRPTIIL